MKFFTYKVLMIEPVAFHPLLASAEDNTFQHVAAKESEQDIQAKALTEFKNLRASLEGAGVKVVVFSDCEIDSAPDSIFPNNWFSTHSNSTLCLYPIRVLDRRKERREHIVEFLNTAYDLSIDYTYHEEKDQFLEGTGSMVLDRESHTAFACVSRRTEKEVFDRWCEEMGYKGISFTSTLDTGERIYHTNVMMAIGKSWAIVCLESVRDKKEKELLKHSLEALGKRIIPISISQMNHYCGNIIQLKTIDGSPVVLMSMQAKYNFTEEQLAILGDGAEIISEDISTIEYYGGGSARCMVAELF